MQVIKTVKILRSGKPSTTDPPQNQLQKTLKVLTKEPHER